MKKQILIVEDQILIALDLEADLLAAGYEVVGIAKTKREALTIAALKRVDLATMDVNLAQGDSGIDTAIELRAAGIRSIFVTGSVEREVRAAASVADPIGYLTKPVDPNVLVQTMGDYFERI